LPIINGPIWPRTRRSLKRPEWLTPKTNFRAFLCAALLALAVPQSAGAEDRSDGLFQYSTINALLHGIYDGDMAFRELARHGDMGLGTFNGLDGEMIALDGRFYQLKTDGKAYAVKPDMKTPFSVMTFFDADKTFALPAGLSFTEMAAHLDKHVASPNNFQAFRIDGAFAGLKVRSVPFQTRPYKALAEVVKDQAVFERANIKGTLVGFRAPDYVAGLNIPGYHFHFLSQDRAFGGHVLALSTGVGTIRMDEITGFEMALPKTKEFSAADLTGERKDQLRKVEKGK